MTDRILLSADRKNFDECVELAVEFGLGIEVMAFAYPDVLDGNWEHTLETYRTLLRYVPGPVTVHGPFMDMVSGSLDTRINQVCYQRYQHAIHIASELDAKYVVFHANYIGSLHNTAYREGWHQRNVIFWYPLAEYARERGLTITLENMWEYEPSIIANVLREVNHANLKACLDVGHTRVFGDPSHTLQDWIATMQPWLAHMHVNNNNGNLDEHHGFDWENGVLDYNEIVPQLQAIKPQPVITLEMYHVNDMLQSLRYFQQEPSLEDKHNIP